MTPVADTTTSVLQSIDTLIMAAGAGVIVVWGLRWWRSGRRDPLRGSPIRRTRLVPAQIPLFLWLAVCGQFAGSVVAHLAMKLHLGSRADLSQDDQSAMALANLAPITTGLISLILLQWAFVGGAVRALFGRARLREQVRAGVLGWLGASCICTLLAISVTALLRLLSPEYQPPEHAAIETMKDREVEFWMRAITFLGALLIAPITEELFFRGLVQSGISRLFMPRPGSLRHRWIAIGLSASLFGAMHSATPQFIPALTVLGVVLGYLYERYGSLLVPIIIHMLFNAKTLLFVLIHPDMVTF